MALPQKGFFGGGKYNVGGSVVEFNPTPFVNVVMANVSSRLEQAGILFTEAAKENFVFMAPPHSMPWDFPHAETGKMEEAIDWIVFDRPGEIVMQAGIIDDNLPGRLNIYPHMLETGTSRMAPRPWLTITLDETWFVLEEIMTGMGAL